MAGSYHYPILQVGEMDGQETKRFSILPGDSRQVVVWLQVWNSSPWSITHNEVDIPGASHLLPIYI